MQLYSHTIKLLRSFVGMFLEFSGIRALYVMILMLLSTILQGFSLVMLIPLLGLVGLGETGGAMDSISVTLKQFLHSSNLSFSLITVLVIFFLIAVSEALFTRFRTIVMNNLQMDFINHLRNSLYRKISRASWQFHSRNHSSESMRLLDNAVGSISGGTFTLLQLVVQLFQAGMFLFIAFKLSATMKFIMLGAAALLYSTLIPINKRLFKHGQKAICTYRTMHRNMVDFFNGLKLAKSYNRTDAHTREYAAIGEQTKQDGRNHQPSSFSI